MYSVFSTWMMPDFVINISEPITICQYFIVSEYSNRVLNNFKYGVLDSCFYFCVCVCVCVSVVFVFVFVCFSGVVEGVEERGVQWGWIQRENGATTL